MPSTDKIIQDLDDTSSRIGEITRTISLSVLALIWLFISGGDNSPTLPIKPSSELLLLSGLFALLSLLADYFQYVSGYANTKTVLTIAEAAEAKSAKYNIDSPLYRLRSFFFWAKQGLALVALILLFVAGATSITKPRAAPAKAPMLTFKVLCASLAREDISHATCLRTTKRSSLP